MRLRDAGRRAHRRRDRLDARRCACPGRGRRDVEPPFPGGELPPARRDADLPLLEYVDWADAVLEEPLRIKDGQAHVPSTPGTGIRWNESAVERYRV